MEYTQKLLQARHSIGTKDDIILSAKLLRKGYFLREIGEVLGVNKERIRQLINFAIRYDVMTGDEYAALKNGGRPQKQSEYFNHILEIMPDLNSKVWTAVRKLYGIASGYAHTAECNGIDRIVSDARMLEGRVENELVKSALDSILECGVPRARLEELANESEPREMPAEAKMIKYILQNFKVRRVSLSQLSKMAKEYVSTNIGLAALGKKHMEHLCEINPACTVMNRLAYAIELGIITQEAYDKKGRETKQETWRTIGKNLRETPVNVIEKIIAKHDSTGESYKQLCRDKDVSYDSVRHYLSGRRLRMKAASLQHQ